MGAGRSAVVRVSHQHVLIELSAMGVETATQQRASPLHHWRPLTVYPASSLFWDGTSLTDGAECGVHVGCLVHDRDTPMTALALCEVPARCKHLTPPLAEGLVGTNHRLQREQEAPFARLSSAHVERATA